MRIGYPGSFIVCHTEALHRILVKWLEYRTTERPFGGCVIFGHEGKQYRSMIYALAVTAGLKDNDYHVSAVSLVKDVLFPVSYELNTVDVNTSPAT